MIFKQENICYLNMMSGEEGHNQTWVKLSQIAWECRKHLNETIDPTWNNYPCSVRILQSLSKIQKHEGCQMNG